MSIRPVDFNGMIQNTHEVAHAKAQEDSKPAVMQENATVAVARNEERTSHQVNETSNESEGQFRWGDRDGNGKGYQGNKNKKEKDGKVKKEETGDGTVFIKNARSSFDITI